MIARIDMEIHTDRDTGYVMDWLMANVPDDITIYSTLVSPR